MPDYIPRKDNKLPLWMNNFKIKLPEHGARLGLTAEEIAKIQSQCDEVAEKLDVVYRKKLEYKSAVSDKNATLRKTLRSVRSASNRMKAHEKYNAASGKDMGIVPPEKKFDKNEYKPNIRATVHVGYVKISYRKKGIDGINIYRKREGDSEFEKLGYDMNSPFLDKTPLLKPNTPERRQYQALGVIGDEQIGQWSNMVEVWFLG